MLFVQFPWPLLAIIEILTKDLHLFSPHNMFRRLAPCSRGGFETNGKLCNIQQTIYLPPGKWKLGQIFTKTQCLKNFIPSGVSPPRGSPAISLPLLSSNWLVPLPVLPQWHQGQWWWRPPDRWWSAGWSAPVTKIAMMEVPSGRMVITLAPAPTPPLSQAPSRWVLTLFLS